MSAKFTCIKCKKNNTSVFPFCKFCGSMQHIAIKIPSKATKEQIDEYVEKLKVKRKKNASS